MGADLNKMDQEYYTPKIEEFHIGFEFELFRRVRVDKNLIEERWMKHKMEIDDTWYYTHKKFPMHILEYIKMGKCRRLKTNKCSFCGKENN